MQILLLTGPMVSVPRASIGASFTKHADQHVICADEEVRCDAESLLSLSRSDPFFGRLLLLPFYPFSTVLLRRGDAGLVRGSLRTANWNDAGKGQPDACLWLRTGSGRRNAHRHGRQHGNLTQLPSLTSCVRVQLQRQTRSTFLKTYARVWMNVSAPASLQGP
jgi:hypothetical protein